MFKRQTWGLLWQTFSDSASSRMIGFALVMFWVLHGGFQTACWPDRHYGPLEARSSACEKKRSCQGSRCPIWKDEGNTLIPVRAATTMRRDGVSAAFGWQARRRDPNRSPLGDAVCLYVGITLRAALRDIMAAQARTRSCRSCPT